MSKQSTLKPLVSIIIPSFNQGRFIKETIDSVLGQAYESIECIVIDGGSTDETLEILKSYGSKIRFISEKDDGQTDAINKGIGMTSGQILTYINSDDYFFPNSVADAIETLRINDCLWVTGDYVIVDDNNRLTHQYVGMYKRFLRLFSSGWLIKIANYIIQPGTFWKRELHERIGLFDASLKYVMDYDFWLRAFAEKKPEVLNKKLSAFRVHKLSKGGSQFESQFDEEMMVLKRYCKNPLILKTHLLHNNLIKFVYRIIK